VNNPAKEAPLLVTNSGLRPGDFTIGSVESRAAARALAEAKTKAKEVHRLVITHIGAAPNDLHPSTRRESENCIVEIIHKTSDGYTSPFA
jgi:hypothetical protein